MNNCLRNSKCEIIAGSNEASGPLNSSKRRLEPPQNQHYLINLVPEDPIFRRITSTTLAQIILDATVRSYRSGLPLFTQIRLAKVLSTAIFQYHSTPWLESYCRSEDVHFFGWGKAITADSVPGPPLAYLNTKITKPHRGEHRGLEHPGPPLARNRLLFGLGIMFLEIAYVSPWPQLIRQLEGDKKSEGENAEFMLARQLVSSLDTQLGVGFRNITEQLIECDFGCGHDMEDPRLQAAFYEAVIAALDKMERRLHNVLF